ncbi:helix-turn-helix domain-containing protein [Pseudomonas alkylphenolica]|uniref:Helix-turn-helix domain-containing protein n=1 Tax=Pseudomonas alkylphenolica TaxID=237609 RepID=A0A6I6GTA1_9PSED|nr:AraC family transcriptional regulator [Pseudomonas alkylphenolica]QGW77690.1 helix-turn-helix domain-containing protein [Pseudomonas alkylphenolica]
MDSVIHQAPGHPGVRLIDARYQQFAFPRHFHLEYHIGLMVAGQQRYAAGGEQQLAGAGDILLMAPEHVHDGASANDQGYGIRILTLDPGWLAGVSRDLSDGRQGLPVLNAAQLRHPQLQQLLNGLHQQQDSLAFQSQLWEALALLLGLGSTLKVSEPGNGFDPQRWRQLRDWLESRLDQPPGLEEMAAFVDLSPWQLLRRFRNHCGLPPQQWLTQLRLERALPRVLAGQSLSAIALDLGFYDQAHFSRLFRRTYGAPPRALQTKKAPGNIF